MSEPIVLIVDDEEMNIDILMTILGDEYDVAVAMDGESALESIEDEKPDLILLDVVMPDMDGFEVCRRLKEDVATKDIPIVFATGLRDDAEREKGMALGASDYLYKPFVPDTVISCINSALKNG